MAGLLTLPCFGAAALAYGETASGDSVTKVGLFPFDGYYEVSQDGTRTGYGYELLQMIAQHSSISYEYVDDVPDWNEMLNMLEDGKLDMLTCVQKSPDTVGRFAFSKEPIGKSTTTLTVKAGNEDFDAEDPQTFGGKKIGVIRGNSHADKFADYAKKQGFEYTEIEFDSLEDLQTAVQSGKVDGCVTSSLRPLRNEWVIEQIDPSPYYIMMRKGDSKLIEKVNSAIRQLDLSAADWRSELYNKYYSPDSGSQLFLTADERDFIKRSKNKVFTVTVCPDNAPYSYFSDGKACGIIPDIFKEIASRAGINYKVIPCTDHKDYDTKISSGKVDMIMDADWGYSASEDMGYKLTNSYLDIAISEITKSSYDGKAKTAAILDGPIEDRLSRNPNFADYKFTKYMTTAETVDAVTSGKCSAAFVYSGVAQRYIMENARQKLHISTIPEADINMSVACLAADDYRLLSVMSKSAESVKSSYAQEVVLESQASSKIHMSALDYVYLNPQVLWIIIMVIILLVIMAVVLIYQRKLNYRQKLYNASLSRAKLEADKANEAKSSFLSSISHDLRTPLNGIIGFTDIALRETDNDKRQEYLEKIKLSGDVLLSMVNDTLDVSRIESGKMTAEPEVIDCRDFYKSIIASVTQLADEKNIELEVDVDQVPDGKIFADRLMLQKIIINLLSNSIKYTMPGGKVNFTASSIDPPENGMTRRIVVSDNGIGMSEEFMEHIYDPFSQEKRPESEGVQGTGLGLSIVKRIVDMLNGTIAVESKVGEGTRFTVELPLPFSVETEDKCTIPTAEIDLAGKNILLCEDNQLNAEIATILLREKKVNVVCAQNGRKAVECVEVSQVGYFDMVLMDIHMPVMDGYEATRTIRALNRADARSLPIVAMTADAFDEDIRRASDAGFSGYITKPVQPAQMFAAINAALAASGEKKEI